MLGTPVHGRLLPAEPVMADAPQRSRLQTFAGVCLVVAALYLAREVLIPFALAALISFLLAPMAARFERLIGRVAAVVVTVMIAFGVLSGVGWIVAGQMTELAAMLPEYRENIANKLGSLRGGVIEQATTTVKEIEQEVQRREKEAKEARQAEEAERAQDRPQSALQPEAGGSPQPKPEEPIRVEVMEPEPSALELIGGAFAPLLGPLGTAGMVIVLVAFMLLARADLRDRIIRLMGRTRIHLTTEAITDAGQRVSRYLLMQTVINGIHGVAVGVGMFFFGVPSFLLWGLLSAVLRFIPYIGPWVAAALPILVSFAVFDGWTQPLLVLGYFIVLELLSNNVLEPWLYGQSAGLSPLAIILTAIFWTWLWGPIGLLLATPITVCLVVLAKHLPQLEFINVLLSDEPMLEPPARFYQRLLAFDFDEAGKIATQAMVEAGSLAAGYDAAIVPALALIDRDRHQGFIDDQRFAAIDGALREIVEEVAEEAFRRSAKEEKKEEKREEKRAHGAPEGKDAEDDTPPKVVLPPGCAVVVLPVYDLADEACAEMLVQAVQACGGRGEAASVSDPPAEMMELVREHAADVVCVSLFRAHAAAKARRLCRRLLAQFPDMPIVVGLWTTPGDTPHLRERIGCGERAEVVGTVHDALAAIARLAARRGVAEPLVDAGSPTSTP